jgi:hypothetical protein
MFGLAYVVSMAASVGIPLMLLIQLDIGMFQMFVPLMGRSGSDIPPDLAIGVLTCISVSSATPHVVSLRIENKLSLKISYKNLLLFRPDALVIFRAKDCADFCEKYYFTPCSYVWLCMHRVVS